MGSKTFQYTGGWQKFDVPTKVDWVTVDVHGGGYQTVRRGGHVKGKIKLKDTDVLWIAVGGHGTDAAGRGGAPGGWPNGGDGGPAINSSGGGSGAGSSAVRLGSTTGSIIAVAGGCGGYSGDNGVPGRGGTTVGESGARGSAGPNSIGVATGGTQTQGGEGGSSSSGGSFGGRDASDGALGQAGNGGGTGGYNGPGGGGGGGGFRSGGGGNGGSTGYAPGSGGGGGSNYTGGLDVVIANERGTGSSYNGTVTLTWEDPAPANQSPSPPTTIKIGGKDASDGMSTGSMGSIDITAVVNDPDKDNTRISVRFYDSKGASNHATVLSDYVATGKTATAKVTGLAQNTHYYLRIYSQDKDGAFSTNYTSVNFWTNRSPGEPTLNSPANFASFDSLTPISFSWTHHDDDGDGLAASEIHFRDADSAQWAGAHPVNGNQPLWVSSTNPPEFKSNRFYFWQVRTKDTHGVWGPWCEARQFYITGTSTPPKQLGPVKGATVHADAPVTFTWKFIDPDPGDSQRKADLRWRPVEQMHAGNVVDTASMEDDWFTLFGSETSPGGSASWTIPANTFQIDYHYEWQIRTYDRLSANGTASDWTPSEDFHAIATPGLLSVAEPITQGAQARGTLGQGAYRAFIFEKGGQRRLAEVTDIISGSWGRVRDDLSSALVTVYPTSGNSGMLGNLRSWLHELVIYRDGARVWEGPITRLGYNVDSVEIEAHDVMAWVYRRIMRQGYNDTGSSKRSVVERAAMIIEQALGPDDPNILPYLTAFQYDDDAQQARVRDAFASTAWEEIDDLAASAGLDYVVAGRRIILFDTHRQIGKLPAMNDSHFADPPIVTEYGMSGATVFGVTNNSGYFGTANGSGVPASGIERTYGYGRLELLASAYGDTSSASESALTAAERATLTATLNQQAQRNLSNRWPIPLQVRVPDGTTLQPTTPIDIQWLVPGVWIPLQAERTIRKVMQWQKLDNIAVSWDNSGEKVAVTMSPAPGAGEDPDADAQAAADAAAGGS